MAGEKIPNALSTPEFCDSCGSPHISLVSNDVIYGRLYGNWPFAHYCFDCQASVGCHPNTEIPLGKMADKETRLLRAKCHGTFDEIWKRGLLTRAKAYDWLAGVLNIPADDCHISWLSRDQLQTAIVTSGEYLERFTKVAERRNIRNRKRANKRNARERKQGKCYHT